jgi:hypothetical protein
LEQDLTAQDEEHSRTPVQRKEPELRTRAAKISCKELEERLQVASETLKLKVASTTQGGIGDFDMILEETKMQAPGPWIDIAKDQVRACRARR